MKTEYQPKTGLPCDCKPGAHRDNCLDKPTPRPWWIAYGQAYAGNGIDLQIAVLKADRDEPRTTPTERDANLELAVRAVNSYDALRAALRDAEAALCSDFPDDLVTCQKMIRDALAIIADRGDCDACQSGDGH